MCSSSRPEGIEIKSRWFPSGGRKKLNPARAVRWIQRRVLDMRLWPDRGLIAEGGMPA